jgi:hypothetical protein
MLNKKIADRIRKLRKEGAKIKALAKWAKVSPAIIRSICYGNAYWSDMELKGQGKGR